MPFSNPNLSHFIYLDTCNFVAGLCLTSVSIVYLCHGNHSYQSVPTALSESLCTAYKKNWHSSIWHLMPSSLCLNLLLRLTRTSIREKLICFPYLRETFTLPCLFHQPGMPSPLLWSLISRTLFKYPLIREEFSWTLMWSHILLICNCKSICICLRFLKMKDVLLGSSYYCLDLFKSFFISLPLSCLWTRLSAASDNFLYFLSEMSRQ